MWRLFIAVSLEFLLGMGVYADVPFWRFAGPGWEVYLPLPPGSGSSAWEGYMARIELPHTGGTTLKELFLLPRLLPQGRGKFLRIGSHIFLFSHSWEGAAGTFYDVFSYAIRLPAGIWLEFSFVASSMDPGALDRPPKPLDPALLRPYFRALLEGMVVRETGNVLCR